MYKVFLGIGGNIGNKQQNFQKVLIRVSIRIGNILKKSSIYETPPWGFHSENNFWNQVILVKTELTAEQLLPAIHKIENEFGRVRSKNQYSNREMDIDILFFENEIIENETLIVPHPRIHLRKFVLIPLVEIEPDFKHPLLRLTNLQLLENCKDQSLVKKIS